MSQPQSYQGGPDAKIIQTISPMSRNSPAATSDRDSLVGRRQSTVPAGGPIRRPTLDSPGVWTTHPLPPGPIVSNAEAGYSFSAVAGLLGLAVVVALRVNKRRRRYDGTAGASPVDVRLLPDVVPNHPLVLPPPTAFGIDERLNLTPLDTTRQLMGSVPRRFAKHLQGYLRVDRPLWLARAAANPLSSVAAHQDRVRRDGRVIWAAMVQTHTALFRAGPIDLSAVAVWSEDAYYDATPDALVDIARELFDIRGTAQADPEVAVFARLLIGDGAHEQRLKVPARFTGGRAVFLSSLIVFRKHLPDGFLVRSLLPVWLDPAGTGNLLPVPAAYWPASLTAWWRRVDERPAERPEKDENPTA